MTAAAETLALLLVGAGLVCAALALVVRAERERMEQRARRLRAAFARTARTQPESWNRLNR